MVSYDCVLGNLQSWDFSAGGLHFMLDNNLSLRVEMNEFIQLISAVQCKKSSKLVVRKTGLMNWLLKF